MMFDSDKVYKIITAKDYTYTAHNVREEKGFLTFVDKNGIEMIFNLNQIKMIEEIK